MSFSADNPLANPTLPYPDNALADKGISEETLQFHYGKHHLTYVKKFNGLLKTMPAKVNATNLITIMQTADKGGLFNNAAQIWNHCFYWDCLTPKTNQKPSDTLLDNINKTFGSFELFQNAFTDASLGLFGSGWCWLVKDQNGQLHIVGSQNAENPLTNHHTPLLTCDVWEHAYYIDTRNNRGAYLKNFWECVHWDFVNHNFASNEVKTYSE